MKSAVTGSRPACHSGVASQLSPRQREILDLVADGRTSKEIAVALGIAESTVNWHLANAFERLGASSRAEAVALSIRANEADRVPQSIERVSPAPRRARVAWRLVAIAIAIAVAGALLGGATVATLRLGTPAPDQGPAPSPTTGSEQVPTASPASGSRQDVIGGDILPVEVGGSSIGGGQPAQPPATLLPVLTAPPLPSVSPPLPSLPLPLPAPIPTLPPLPTP